MKLLTAAALCGALAFWSVGVARPEPANGDFAEKAHREMQPVIAKGEGIVDVPSRHTVDETLERLKQQLQAKGIAIFALIDHSGEAEKVGLTMPPTKLLIFGNPKGGTPPMLAAPSLAIDLPLKILVWEDGSGKVWLSYNSLEYLRERHGVPQDLIKNLAVVQVLATEAGQ
jgi:uncharacterized protein (DUF302 family)